MSVSNWRDRASPIVFLSNNLISRIGVALVTCAGTTWLFFLPTFLQGHAGSAYVGILLFLLLPATFFAGLVLIPVGMLMQRRRLHGALPAATGGPVFSWTNPNFRRLAVFVLAVTGVNMVIGANFTYRAVEHMESVQFCGATCHVVMKPEFTAYQNSPHSKVDCVKCHIGPGASWFVQSKLSGTRQLFAVALNTFERPVPSPVADLRPARETCEGCHWPDKYGGDKLKVISHFNDQGQETKSVLLMKIGGGGYTRSGIHTAHVGQGVRVRYAHSDRARQNISWVEYDKGGEKREFFAAKAKPEDISKMNIREMDCIDCHNRPSHAFEVPERALDNAMAARDVVPDLPQIRQTALEVIKKSYSSSAQGEQEIPQSVERFYREKHPDIFAKRQPDIARSAKGILALWQRNVFPDMKVVWGTHVNNIGHNDYPGCFRCHDGEHKTKDGVKAIGQDCNSCHVMLAMEETNPKVLKDLGLQ